MKTFRRWNKKIIEDDGAYCSDECKSFYKAFKNFIKRSFPDAEIIGFETNHYDTFGFIKQDGRCIYVSHSMDRRYNYCTVDFKDNSCMNGVLYRIAKDEHSYSRNTGRNHFASINTMVEEIKNLIKGRETWEEIL